MKRDRTIIAVIMCLCFVVFCLSACGRKAVSMADSQQTEERAGDVQPDSRKQEENQEAEEAGLETPDISSPAVCGKLSVEGTQLVDEKGKAVQLRGLSTHGLSFYPQYINEEFFAQLRREWKANVIRLAMYTAESGGYCTDGDKEYLKNLVRAGVE